MSQPVARLLDALRGKGLKPRKAGEGWASQCADHDDRNTSLSIPTSDDDGVLWHCHAGCAKGAVIAVLAPRFRDLILDSPRRAVSRGTKPQLRANPAEAAPATTEAKSEPAPNSLTTLSDGEIGGDE